LYSYLGVYTTCITDYTINKRGDFIINYTPFWDTIKEKEISTYTLVENYRISKSLIDKLKHNKGITTSTLNHLCHILECELSDIAEYKPDKE